MIKTYPFYSLKKGKTVKAFEIENKRGEKAVVLDYGAAIASLEILDRQGKTENVILGPKAGEDPTEFKYLGAVMGRCGNRIENAAFSIGEKSFHLAATEGPHHLHGASGNWAKQFFKGRALGDDTVLLELLDDGRDGWECQAEVKLTYTFDDHGALTLKYRVKALGDTVISPTNHSYFNLDPSWDLLDTEIKIFSDLYAPKSPSRMPHGTLASVSGTPLDFRQKRSFKEALTQAQEFFPPYQKAYDDFYSLLGGGFRQGAEVYSKRKGRVLRVFTDAPALILYTPTDENGKPFAFCLETQYMPNAVNCPEYPSPVFKKGETMTSSTIYAFDATPQLA